MRKVYRDSQTLKSLFLDSFRVLYQPEAQGAGTVHAWVHQQQFAVFAQFISLRKVPNGSLRLVVAPAAQNSSAGMLVE